MLTVGSAGSKVASTSPVVHRLPRRDDRGVDSPRRGARATRAAPGRDGLVEPQALDHGLTITRGGTVSLRP